MKDLIKTLKNIWAIEELRKRIIMTFALILIYRIGSYVVLPGVDPDKLAKAGTDQGLAGLLDLFSGGAFLRASIFALGIMPYISASIIMQLLGIAVPAIQKMQREGESGRKRINQWTRFLTIFITFFQAPGYIATSVPEYARTDAFSWWLVVLILISGTMFVMWLGEKITDRGIGNGISLIIMIGIIARFPSSFIQELVSRHSNGGYVILLVEVVMLLMVIAFTIMLVQGTRRIPVQFAKRIVGNKQYGGVRNYIPLKVNSAGVMPIIFAQALMFIPMYVNQATDGKWFTGLVSFDGFWYNFIFAIFIILFTYFYTAIMVNPRSMAEEMKRNGGFIPGVKPGKQTESFIDSLISRITLPGAIFLATIAILPAFAINFGIKQQFAYFYGGTSLLIMVGVVLDTLQQIETHLLSRHYDGLMKSGKIKGRGVQMPSMAS
ncbi:MAG: preprotein translocase subunit SecY [Bacteroidota bacterium]